MAGETSKTQGETYDPASYWNTREHPNSTPDAGVGPIDQRFISPHLTGVNSVLEIGPGVGRLFPLYKAIPRVATLDLSRNYHDRAQASARAEGIYVEANYVDKALAWSAP